MKFKSYFLSFLGFVFFNQILTIKSSPELNTNSIIKIFCIENVKSEIRKANLIYRESFGNNVCDCYLPDICQIWNNAFQVKGECNLTCQNNFPVYMT